jgi:hypothetical protein
MSPDLEEIENYATLILGMKLPEDNHLLEIAKQGLIAPVPEPWQVIKDENDNIRYHNQQTQEISEFHPSDSYFRQLFILKKNEILQHQNLQYQHL